jgi:hypothetical protein
LRIESILPAGTELLSFAAASLLSRNHDAMSDHSASATVLLPTTGEKGPVIQYALASVLAQSVASIEVFVIGDGAGESTRHVVNEIAQHDPRVRFFDLPKGVRRGETYRHDLLTREARGRIVCYLCDRDLWCRDHVAALSQALETADMATSLAMIIEGPAEHQWRLARQKFDLRLPDYRRGWVAGKFSLGPLSAVGHTLEMYRRLARGWETTPEKRATDQYMWRKFLVQPDCRFNYAPRATVLAFRQDRWSEDAHKREPALRTWCERVLRDDWTDRREDLVTERTLLGGVPRGVWARATMRGKMVAGWVRRNFYRTVRLAIPRRAA